MGTGFFPQGVKRRGRDVDHSHPYSLRMIGAEPTFTP
jgi:hypothetical protein